MYANTLVPSLGFQNLSLNPGILDFGGIIIKTEQRKTSNWNLGRLGAEIVSTECLEVTPESSISPSSLLSDSTELLKMRSFLLFFFFHDLTIQRGEDSHLCCKLEKKYAYISSHSTITQRQLMRFSFLP